MGEHYVSCYNYVASVAKLITTEASLGRLYVLLNVWACLRYGKYHEGIMIAHEGRSPEGAINNS